MSALLIVFFCLNALPLQGQNIPVEEFSNKISQQNPSVLEDFQNIEYFFEQLRRARDFEGIIQKGGELAELARVKKNKKIELWARFYATEASRRLNFQEPDLETRTLISAIQETDEIKLLALAFKLESDYFSQISNGDSVSHYLELASSTIQEVKGFESDTVLQIKLGQFQHNLASQYYRKQQYDEALEIVLSNIELAKRLGDIGLEVRGLQVAASIYSAMGLYGVETNAELDVDWYLDQSKKYTLLFVEGAEKLKNRYLLGFAYSMRGNLFAQDEQFDSAVVYFERSISYVNKEQNPASYISRLGSIAANLNKAGRLEEADEKFFEAYLLAKEIGNEVNQTRLSNNLSYNALLLNQLSRARNFANESIELSLKLNRYGTASQAYGNLSEIEKKAGNFEKALKAYEFHIQYRDSLLKVENLSRIEELETKYETEKKEVENIRLSKENELQEVQIQRRNAQILFISIILVLIIFGLYMWSRKKVLEEKQLVQEANQQLLSVQMNPHFLFNSLVAIQSFVIQRRDANETSNFIAKFAKVTRMVLNFSREKLITLEEEITLLKEFLRLQQVRTNDKFDFDFLISEELNPSEILIPPMLSQPFIENAVEHGILPISNKRGRISVEIKREKEVLFISIDDNGVGMSKELNDKKPHSSLATKITTERFNLLKRITGKPFSYRIINKNLDSNNSGVRIEFKLPIMKK